MARQLSRFLLLATLLLLPGSVQADEPWHAYNFFSLTGGLNDAFDPTAIAINEAADLQNVVFTVGGAIAKRSGFSRLNTTASPSATAVTTGGTFFKLSSGTRYLVRIVNDATDVIQSMNYGAGTTGPNGTWNDITGSISLAVGNDDQADFASALDVLVIEDGVSTTPPFQWTGSGNVTNLTNAPNASMVEYHKNHLFAAGSSANPSQVAFSNICTTSSTCLTTWTATDVFNVETNDGQIVRALKSGLDALYIWKDASIWRASGSTRDSFFLEQMVRGIGTLSNDSVRVINNQFVFKTQFGDYAVYDGAVTVQIISTKIKGTLTGFNQDRIDNARAATLVSSGTGNEDYYACETNAGSSTNNRLLLYDTYHRAWTKFVGINCNALWPYELGTLQQALAFGDYSGFVNRYPNTDADAGTAISAYYQSGQLQFDLPQEKIFRLAQVFVNQSGSWNLTFEYRIDFEGTGTSAPISLTGSGAVWDTAIFDQASYADLTTTIGRVEGFRTCDFFQWRVSNANASEPFTVKGVRLWFEPTNRVGGIAKAGWEWLDRWIMPQAFAGDLTEAPPLPPTLRDVYLYLKQIHRQHNNLTVVTANPNGSRRGRVGDLILYNNGGSWKECHNTDGTTTWVCEANARTAP